MEVGYLRNLDRRPKLTGKSSVSSAKLPMVISITSGKGGVGKSSFAANLSLSLAAQGNRVLLLDGDFGLANLDILFDIKAENTLHDVLYNNRSISDIILPVAPRVDIIPASSGIMEMTSLGPNEKHKLLDLIEGIEQRYDVLLIDTGAGINDDVTWLNSSADEIVVVVTPEPTSITDAYALIKVLNKNNRIKKFKILVNQARSKEEALKVYNHISSVSDRFLNVGLDYIGFMLWDESVSQAIRMRKPIMKAFPNSMVAQNISDIGRQVMEKFEKPRIRENVQFFWKTLLGNA